MTTANAGMQQAISAKIKQYPKKAQTDMHTARCILPAKVAHVLLHKPQLVSPAVQTFHYREMQDMRAAANLAHFPPEVGIPFVSCSQQYSVTSLAHSNKCMLCRHVPHCLFVPTTLSRLAHTALDSNLMNQPKPQ